MKEDPKERYEAFKTSLCNISGYESSFAAERSDDARRFVKKLNALEELARRASENADGHECKKAISGFIKLSSTCSESLKLENIRMTKQLTKLKDFSQNIKENRKVHTEAQKQKRTKHIYAAVAAITALSLASDWYKGENFEIVRIIEFCALVAFADKYNIARRKHNKALELEEKHKKDTAQTKRDLAEAKDWYVQTEFKLAALELLIQINNPVLANDNQQQATQKPAALSIK